MEKGGNTTSLLTRENWKPELHGDFESVEKIEFLQEVLNTSPYISVIINKNRQIVLSNFHLTEILSASGIEDLFGKLPGEVFSCVNQTKDAVCGGSEKCRFCGIMNTVQQSQVKATRIAGECRITSRDDQRTMYYDYRVICSPLYFNGHQYTLVNLVDISGEKRSSVLENVFFHDLLNRLGGISGIIQVLKTENGQEHLNEYIDLLESISDMAIEEIQSQRQLKAAENNDLLLNIRKHSTKDILESVRKQILFHPVMKSLKLQVDSMSPDIEVITDSVLVKRILLNMTKNAAEATPENGIISVCCIRMNNKALFSVNNPGVIPYDTQLQIFQRSYTTKGNGRGLGTYSMKLYGETYLKGKVYFNSDEVSGTTFTLEIPLILDGATRI